MKNTFKIFLFCLTVNFAMSQSSKKDADAKKYTIIGKITRTFCAAPSGGAIMDKGLPGDKKTNNGATATKKVERKINYVSKTLHIRKGNVNTIEEKIVLSFKTDTAGKFSFQLPPGIYSIIQEAQVEEIKEFVNDGHTRTDVECMKEWWKKPYQILEIKESDVQVNLFFEQNCHGHPDIPCIWYNNNRR